MSGANIVYVTNQPVIKVHGNRNLMYTIVALGFVWCMFWTCSRVTEAQKETAQGL